MTKNVKMLFALLAAAAVMVGVSFAKDITTPEELVDGAASADFVLSKDIIISGESADVAILKIVSVDAEGKTTLDMHGHKIVLSGDDAESNIALLQQKSMDIVITNNSSDAALISMDKPLYGSDDPKELTATITLNSVKYVNNGECDDDDDVSGAMFVGNASYDVTVNFVAADVTAEQLLSSGDNAGYKFNVGEGTIIRASLDNVERANFEKFAEGVQFSDPAIETIISGDEDYFAEKSGDLYVVRVITAAEVETSSDLKNNLEKDIEKRLNVNNNIEVTEDLEVVGVKTLDLQANTISLDNAGFILTDGADLTVQSGDITVISGDKYIFDLTEGGYLMVSGDVKLYSAEMKYVNGGGYGNPEFKNGAMLWFGDDKKAVEGFEKAYLQLQENENNALANLNDDKGNQYLVAVGDGWYEVSDTKPSNGGGSSVGCNAGFAALALLALAFIPAKKKK